jgi:DNA gyrase/topoisomerase IV subunit A
LLLERGHHLDAAARGRVRLRRAYHLSEAQAQAIPRRACTGSPGSSRTRSSRHRELLDSIQTTDILVRLERLTQVVRTESSRCATRTGMRSHRDQSDHLDLTEDLTSRRRGGHVSLAGYAGHRAVDAARRRGATPWRPRTRTSRSSSLIPTIRCHFSNRGKVYWLKVRTAAGRWCARRMVNLLLLEEVRDLACAAAGDSTTSSTSCSWRRAGTVKRPRRSVLAPALSGIIAVDLHNDQPWSGVTDGERETVLAPSGGKAIRSTVMRCASWGEATGVRGIRLGPGQDLIADRWQACHRLGHWATVLTPSDHARPRRPGVITADLGP